MSRPSRPAGGCQPGKTWPLLAPLLLAGACVGAHADGEGSAVRLSGFATLAVTHNDSSEAGAITSFSQTRPVGKGWSPNLDSVLGLQLDWQPLQGTSFMLQGVARAGEDLRPQLRAAYLRQQLGDRLALRVGRFRSPLYFDSDIAEIGYANLMARPALPLYGMVNSVASLDGADLQWQFNLNEASLRAQLFSGGYDYQHRFNNLQPVQSADARLRGAVGFALNLQTRDAVLRLSRTEMDRFEMRSAQVEQFNGALTQLNQALLGMAAQMPGPAGAALQARAQSLEGLRNPFDNRPIYTSLGLDLNWQRWRLMGELAQMDSRAALVGRYRGYSLTLARSFDELTPYVNLASQRRSGSGMDTSALAPTGLDPRLDGGMAQLGAGYAQAQRFADLSMRSASLGLRWDWREHLALKLQYDRVSTPDSMTPGSLAVRQLPMSRRLQLLSVSLDMTF